MRTLKGDIDPAIGACGGVSHIADVWFVFEPPVLVVCIEDCPACEQGGEIGLYFRFVCGVYDDHEVVL